MLKEFSEDGQDRWTWTCPRKDCHKYILAYSEKGLKMARETHEDMHWREDKEKLAESIATFEKRGKHPPEYYNKLILTLHDIDMFEVHGIKIDEDCIIGGYDGQSREPKS